jgi:phosphoglycerate kinase
MAGIKYFPSDLNVENKTIILRLDFNVPLIDGKIQDYTRISLSLPFLEELIKKKAKIIILSHLGRPEGTKKKSLSLISVYKYLKKKIKTNIYFFMGEIDNETKNKTSYLNPGEIMLIDNIRFFKGEGDNDKNFAEKLGSLGEIYINDAFSCSHREQASIHRITEFVKYSYAGPLLKKEIEAIDSVILKKKEPVTCIIGGSKISTKINIILSLIKKVNNIVIVGAMANNFLLHNNIEIGKSLIEKDSWKIVEKILLESKKTNCKIIIPEDFKISESFEGSGTFRKQGEINKNEIILDIGPITIKKIEEIIDKSSTVLWNGPAGYFENNNFAKGTYSIAKKISENTSSKSLISIIGGGDTISAINKIEIKLTFTHLSTAGGAFLEFLEGKDLPGLGVLK